MEKNGGGWTVSDAMLFAKLLDGQILLYRTRILFLLNVIDWLIDWLIDW
jgi:hypothetical protein